MSEIRDGESVTAFTMRRIREDLAEECAKIAEGHVGAMSSYLACKHIYDEACRDIAKAIRDAHGVKE